MGTLATNGQDLLVVLWGWGGGEVGHGGRYQRVGLRVERWPPFGISEGCVSATESFYSYNGMTRPLLHLVVVKR